MQNNATNNERELHIPQKVMGNDNLVKFFLNFNNMVKGCNELRLNIVRDLISAEIAGGDDFRRDYYVSIGQEMNFDKADIHKKQFSENEINRAAESVVENLFKKPSKNGEFGTKAIYCKPPEELDTNEQILYKAITDNIWFASNKEQRPQHRALSSVYLEVVLHEVFSETSLHKPDSSASKVVAILNGNKDKDLGLGERTAIYELATKICDGYKNLKTMIETNKQPLNLIEEGKAVLARFEEYRNIGTSVNHINLAKTAINTVMGTNGKRAVGE